MAKGFNKVVLMGNLTRDPETRTTPNGQSVTSITLAVNRQWSQDGEKRESVSYIDCVIWGKPGEIIAQYVTKGRALLVSGRLEQRSWDDKETGQKRSKVEVIVEDFNFVDSRGAGGGDSGMQEASATASAGASAKPKKQTDDVVIEDIGDEPINLDDIPF